MKSFFFLIPLFLTAAVDARSTPSGSRRNRPARQANQSLPNALFPVPSIKESWSTAAGAPHRVPLTKKTLRSYKTKSKLPIKVSAAPDGKRGLQAHFPKGSYTLSHKPLGGMSFYASGPASVDLTTAKEVTFGYSIFFEHGFGWQLGGKLPGLYGGSSDEVAVECSGGSRLDSCFSVRLMWRAKGLGELYTYLPPSFSENKRVCDIPPKSHCNPTYGASVGRGAFHFKAGRWNAVSERVRLNDVGEANGELELYVEGKSVIKATGLVFRKNDAGRIRGIQMQTFFGGSHPEYASPKDQNVWFSDLSVAITQEL